MIVLYILFGIPIVIILINWGLEIRNISRLENLLTTHFGPAITYLELSDDWLVSYGKKEGFIKIICYPYSVKQVLWVKYHGPQSMSEKEAIDRMVRHCIGEEFDREVLAHASEIKKGRDTYSVGEDLLYKGRHIKISQYFEDGVVAGSESAGYDYITFNELDRSSVKLTLSQGELYDVWKEIVNSLPQPRLKKAITETKTRYLDNEIHILVTNHAQKIWIEEKMKENWQEQLRLKTGREVLLFFDVQKEL